MYKNLITNKVMTWYIIIFHSKKKNKLRHGADHSAFITWTEVMTQG